MYYMFLGSMQIPIPPPTMQISIKNKNKTATLLNLGEVNLLKNPGLTEVSFEIMLPNSTYPFNQSMLRRFLRAEHYLKKLKKMKLSQKPFQFIVVRLKPDGSMLFNTNMKVTLEEYSIKESHDDGFDVIVPIKLKQWRDYGTKTVAVTTDSQGNMTGRVNVHRGTDRVMPNQIQSDGGSLWSQLRQATGSGDNIFRIAALNKIAVPTAIAVGEVLKLRE